MVTPLILKSSRSLPDRIVGKTVAISNFPPYKYSEIASVASSSLAKTNLGDYLIKEIR